MPKADPAQWKEAREQWETSELTLTEVAERLGVAIPTVSLRARRECWVKSDIIAVQKVNYTAQQLVEVGIRALVRAASQTRDMATAVKAAGMLLDRAMGRVTAEQSTPMLPPDDQQHWPEWLKAQRLAYAVGAVPSEDGAPALQEALEGPDLPDPLPEPSDELPASQGELPARHLRSVPAPQPQFWDAPGHPAS